MILKDKEIETALTAMMHNGDCDIKFNKALVKLVEILVINSLEHEDEYDDDYDFDIGKKYLTRLLRR